jgi:hypothetical protein
MKKFLLFLTLFALACNQPKEKAVEKPADLIPEDKMVQVLADVHLLEAALNLRFPQANHPLHNNGPIELMHDTIVPNNFPDANSQVPLSWYDIFQKNGVTKKQYESSMKWYCSDPEKLSALYDDVIVELTKRQTKEKIGK